MQLCLIAAGLITLHEFGFATLIKNISMLFNKLGDLELSLIMPYVLETADGILGFDKHQQLRTCYLKLIKNIVVDVFTGENLTEEQKEIHDEFLDL